MALDFGKIGAAVLASETGGASAALGVNDVTTGDKGKGGGGNGFLKNLFGSNDTVIPEAKTITSPNNTGVYLVVIVIVVALGAFLYFTFKK